MDLGSKIKNIRYNNNMSQEDMAKLLKINRNYLSRIETNKSLPTAEVLARLAEAFSISVDSLLGISLDDKEETEARLNQYCTFLNNTELDFVVNMLCVMTNNSRN